jgi:hypothetical protein
VAPQPRIRLLDDRCKELCERNGLVNPCKWKSVSSMLKVS